MATMRRLRVDELLGLRPKPAADDLQQARALFRAYAHTLGGLPYDPARIAVFGVVLGEKIGEAVKPALALDPPAPR